MAPLVSAIPPPRRPELVMKPLGRAGRHVLKDPLDGACYQFGEEESFLFVHLDGRQSREAIRAAFEAAFGEPLSEEELEDFIALARARGFLCPDNETPTPAPLPPPVAAPAVAAVAAPARTPARHGLGILYCRQALFNPDRLLNWLEPKVRFFWTPAFLFISLAGIVAALALAWSNRLELGTTFAYALRWETIILVWVTLILATLCHEFAHGLTCKHYGGEVHEIGFLLIFFMPSLYCNVTDAWLFPQKSRRLLVTLAGSYCDLVIWSLAVFCWRLTQQHTLVNYIAFVVLSVVGTRIFFNCNPLLKLDGYYLLSDLLEVPNLQQRGQGYLLAHLRRLLWGAAPPEPEPRAGTLLAYGLVSWLFSLAFLTLLLVAMAGVFVPRFGRIGMVLMAFLGYLALRGLVGGVGGGEIKVMLTRRHKRALFWGAGLAAAVTTLCVIEKEDRISGPFQVRAVSRAELRAPVAGFLQTVHQDEGDRVEPYGLVAQLEVPTLTTRIAQREAELRESRARLRLLEIGPRPEEVTAQRRRVERAQAWRDRAEHDLTRARESFDQEVVRLDKQITQYRAEWENAEDAYRRASQVVVRGALPPEHFREVEKRLRVTKAQLEQAEAMKRSRQVLATQEAEDELVRRQRELAEAQAALTLLEAGTRPEELEAERAHLQSLEAEAALLRAQQQKLLIRSPIAGLVITPRLRERIGSYFREGDLIAEIEEPAALEAEITLSEQDVAPIAPGQAVELKLQALPYETFHATVARIAPRALRSTTPTQPHTVTVYGQLTDPSPELRSGMSGHARITCGREPLGKLLTGRLLRFVRTEFWW
jgi:multidrug efflux pump subunit AcrA (membrane-fusion protein)